MIDKILLFPYYLALKWRDRSYKRPGRKFHFADVPTLCIGNVNVGGTASWSCACCSRRPRGAAGSLPSFRAATSAKATVSSR